MREGVGARTYSSNATISQAGTCHRSYANRGASLLAYQALPDPGSSKCYTTHISYTTIDSTMQQNDSGMCFLQPPFGNEVLGSLSLPHDWLFPVFFSRLLDVDWSPKCGSSQKKGRGLNPWTDAQPSPHNAYVPRYRIHTTPRPADSGWRELFEVGRMAWPTSIEVLVPHRLKR